MKKIIIIFLLITRNLHAENFQLEKIYQGFDRPLSISFVDNNNVLVTEKSGNMKFLNLDNLKISNISHNLKILEDGQGGLLDILFKDNRRFCFILQKNRSKGMSSTSVAKANFEKKNMFFKNIFRAEPPINSGYHFGSRLVIKDKHYIYYCW